MGMDNLSTFKKFTDTPININVTGRNEHVTAIERHI